MSFPILKKPKLNNGAFYRISKFINTEYGIKLPLSKKVMIESRLLKRLRELGFESFNNYVDYIFSSDGKKDELISMVDILTTNKTDFFREPDHFNYLMDTILPEMAADNLKDTNNICNAWSCGCSSGEEPYTLAMFLSEFSGINPSFNYQILGTDVCSRVLKTAREAIYTEASIEPVPMQFRHKYLLRSKSSENTFVKIKPEIKKNVQFKYINLMDNQYSVPGMMDLIFFRNVAIYFSKPTHEEIVNKICRHLKQGGYLFIGHSESLFNMDVPVKQVMSTIYRKTK